MSRPALRGPYVITDPHLILPTTLVETVAQAIEGGAGLVQYRHKGQDRGLRQRQAEELAALCQEAAVPLIVNDDIELAERCGAQGIHLGRTDASIAQARRRLGAEALIGVSCYNELDRALGAEAEGADYVAFGSMYPSPTKPTASHASPDLIHQARRQLSIPICAIGGITPDNALAVIEAGADMVAVISAVFGTRDPRAATQRLAALFD